MKSILHLNLHWKFLAADTAGTKRTEFRAYTPYWRRRIENREYDVIRFHNDYATDAPLMVVEYHGCRVQGKGTNKEFAIRLGRSLNIKRWRKNK